MAVWDVALVFLVGFELGMLFGAWVMVEWER